jgi:DNA-binding XRE family transcriptional regulator
MPNLTMKPNYINAMERGLRAPSLTTIIRLAVALDCKTIDFVGMFDKRNLRSFLPK